MTPKEKAKELTNKYLRTYPIYDNPTVVISYTHNEAKQCALIAVDEIINYSMPSSEFGGYVQSYTTEYWQEVKQEIEKL